MLLKSILFVALIFLLDVNAFAQFYSRLKYGEVKDIEGNTYKTIKIGTQTWMAENLRTTKYRNGTPIKNITDDDEWGNDKTGAWCYYENDESNNKLYGKLYNWYAVTNNNQICPKGWHVPTDEEWTTLINYLDPEADGGDKDDNIAGGKMKSTGTQCWISPNEGATNSSGFSALPGGYREDGGIFGYIRFLGIWSSSTKYDTSYSWYRHLFYENGLVGRFSDAKTPGFSVRCLRD